jgi:hypothetical protein
MKPSLPLRLETLVIRDEGIAQALTPRLSAPFIDDKTLPIRSEVTNSAASGMLGRTGHIEIVRNRKGGQGALGACVYMVLDGCSECPEHLLFSWREGPGPLVNDVYGNFRSQPRLSAPTNQFSVRAAERAADLAARTAPAGVGPFGMRNFRAATEAPAQYPAASVCFRVAQGAWTSAPGRCRHGLP